MKKKSRIKPGVTMLLFGRSFFMLKWHYLDDLDDQHLGTIWLHFYYIINWRLTNFKFNNHVDLESDEYKEIEK